MSSPLDDMPALESAPLLFSLTHLSEAAAASAGVAADASSSVVVGSSAVASSRRQGQKRARRDAAEDAEAESESDAPTDESEEEDEEDEGSDEEERDNEPATSAGARKARGSTSQAADAWDDEAIERLTHRPANARAKKEADVGGVGRALFPIVQTIHASAFLGREIDVKTVARRCVNAVFVPPSGVRFAIRRPAGMAMVYTSGKYVCMGGKSTVDMVTIARKVARKIQRIGNQPGGAEYKSIGFHNFSLNNISAHAAFGYRLNLRALSEDPAFMDYTEYEPEQWKGLFYKLPVDPTKTLADLLPSYAFLQSQRAKKEQFSNDEFLGTGDHAVIGVGKGALSYYNTTGTTGSRAPKTAAADAKPTPIKLPPSLNGQILTATIFANGRLTLTGVRKEKDIHDAYLRLWRILQPFATSMPPAEPPTQPPYPRAFLPGQRRKIKQEQEAAGFVHAPSTAAAAAFPQVDIKPNVSLRPHTGQSSSMFVLPAESFQTPSALRGTFASVKPEAPMSDAVKSESHATAPIVKSEGAAFATSGDDAPSAIVLEGLPDESAPPAEEIDDVDWE